MGDPLLRDLPFQEVRAGFQLGREGFQGFLRGRGGFQGFPLDRGIFQGFQLGRGIVLQHPCLRSSREGYRDDVGR